jgi:uncharacterized protein
MHNKTFVKPTWEEIHNLAKDIADRLKASGKKFDHIIVPARGGFIPGRIISEYLGINQIYTVGLSFYHNDDSFLGEPVVYQPLDWRKRWGNLLVIDDIIDSGRTIKWLYNDLSFPYKRYESFTVASLYYKPNRLGVVPDFFGEQKDDPDEWLVFPYEIAPSI